MTKTRLEAFSDGVIAIIITIMVLELKPPHEASWHAAKELLPVFGSYVISFLMVGIYWGNHHHLIHTITHVNGKILWANMHLLFWLSMVPFATAWNGETGFDKIPVAVYAVILNLCGLAYYILLRVIANSHAHHEALQIPLEKQTRKGMLSLAAYTSAIAGAFLHTGISIALFIIVGIMWLIPDQNIERSAKE